MDLRHVGSAAKAFLPDEIEWALLDTREALSVASVIQPYRLNRSKTIYGLKANRKTNL